MPPLPPFFSHFVVFALLATGGQRVFAQAPVAASSSPLPKTTQVLSDQVYFEAQDKLLCDVFLPVTVKESSAGFAQPPLRPVVLLIHGGGWTVGSKWTMHQHAALFAERGIVAVTMNYHLAPAHKFPTQIDDVRLAYDWIRRQSERWSLDPSRMGLYGYSAGAHLASLIGTLADEPLEIQQKTSRLDPDHPLLREPIRPAAIVAGGTPCDFRSVPEDSAMFTYFLSGTRKQYPETYRLASPAALVSAQDVPIFFFHGTEDNVVPFDPCDQFCRSQQALQLASRLHRVEKQGHFLTFIDPQARDASVDYLVKQLTDEPQAKVKSP